MLTIFCKWWRERDEISVKRKLLNSSGSDQNTWNFAQKTLRYASCFQLSHRFGYPDGLRCVLFDILHSKRLMIIMLRWPTRDTLQTKKKRWKQKRNAANKKETLQTKEKRRKQKRNAANKKETLQTKKKRCKQKRSAANKKETLQTKKGTAANMKKGTLQIKKRNASNKKEERCK